MTGVWLAGPAKPGVAEGVDQGLGTRGIERDGFPDDVVALIIEQFGDEGVGRERRELVNELVLSVETLGDRLTEAWVADVVAKADGAGGRRDASEETMRRTRRWRSPVPR